MKILVIQTAFLGDLILTMPMIKTLRNRFPNDEIHLMIRGPLESLLQAERWVDKIFPYDKRGREKGLLAWGRYLRDLRREKYQLVICPHRSFRSGLMTWLSRAPKRVGFSRTPASFAFNQSIRRDLKLHEVERNLSLLSVLTDASPVTQSWEPVLEAQLIDKTDELLRSHDVDENTLLAGIMPGSQWDTKRWLPVGFAELIVQLKKRHGIRTVIIGAPADEQVASQIMVQDGVKSADCVNLAGKTTLDMLAPVLNRCCFLVANDSGPAHLAAALKLPVISVFGPTVPEFGFAPFEFDQETGNYRMVQVKLSCRPCDAHGPMQCPLGHFHCMRKISSAMVMDAVAALPVLRDVGGG